MLVLPHPFQADGSPAPFLMRTEELYVDAYRWESGGRNGGEEGGETLMVCKINE